MGRLLLVDHVADLTLLEACLAPLECEMVRATSGAAAPESLSRDRIGRVLLDVMMPAIGGIEVLQSLREGADRTCIPVVLITDRREHGDRPRGLAPERTRRNRSIARR